MLLEALPSQNLQPRHCRLLVRAGVDSLDANDRRALRRVLAALGA